MKSPKWRLIYVKRYGDRDVYVITNPTIMKGDAKTTFSNEISRKFGINKIGFRACCVNRDFQPRSFYFDKIEHLTKVSLFEEVVS
jgi:hypothetical protein